MTEAPFRIAVVSTGIPHREPHPRLSASMLILYHYLRGFRARGAQIHHLLLLEAASNIAELFSAYEREASAWGGCRVRRIQIPSLYAPRARVWSPRSPAPLPAPAVAFLSEAKPDVIFCLDAVAAALIQDVPVAPKVVQVHDQLFQVKWFHALYRLREHPLSFLSLPIEWIRCRQWRLFYVRALKDAARIPCAVHSAARELCRIGIHAAYLPFPWPALRGVGGVQQLPEKPTFLFLGNLSGLGSRSALHYLFRKLYPELLRQWGADGFRVFISGTNKASDFIFDNIRARPELEFIGFVQDIEALLLSCHGAIAPMDVKTGNRSRVITSMSLGCPAIAHRNVALGNPSLKDGETCYLAKDPREFAQKMKRAFERGPEVLAIIARAKESYEREFEPEVAVEAMLKELRLAAKAQHEQDARATEDRATKIYNLLVV